MARPVVTGEVAGSLSALQRWRMTARNVTENGNVVPWKILESTEGNHTCPPKPDPWLVSMQVGMLIECEECGRKFALTAKIDGVNRRHWERVL